MADPLASLLVLKNLQQQTPVPNRNEATALALRTALGIPGPDTGDISQSDLQDAYNQLVEGPSKGAEQAKMQQIQAQYQVPEAMKSQSALDVEQARAASAQAMPGIQERANEQELQAIGGAPGGGAAGGMRPSISASGKMAFGAAPQMSQQTRTMMEGAQMMEPHIAQIADEASSLDQAGLFGPMMSRVRSALAQAGTIDEFANLVSSDPELNRDPQVGRFATSLGLLASGLGRVHGGSRGGASPQMYANFRALLSDAGTLPMFLGRLQGADDYMTGYAQGPQPNAGPSVSDKLKAMIGVQ